MQDSQNPQSSQSEPAAEKVEATSTEETIAETISVNETGVVDDDAPPDLAALLKEAERKSVENHDAWLRSMADVENIRKRSQTEVANAHKYAIDNFSTELIPVMDSLEAALTVENATVENYKDGMELTQKQLNSVFEKFNIKVINPVGEKFDPNYHQAMCAVDADIAPNTVVHVMQKGYMLHDRVIRPALVSVAKAKET